MRILITGGCGFLGSHLVEHFLKLDDGIEIIILDKLSYASSGFDRLRDIEVHGERGVRDHVRVKVIGCDLSHPISDGVAHEIGRDIDYVIHAAAESHVDNSIIDPLPFLQSNVIGTHHLLWWARSHTRIKRIFLVSTDEVYGPAAFGDDVSGFDERAPFRPANPYAAAKAGGEAVGMAYANTYRLPITIVNTMNLIGERQGAEKFIPTVIRKVLAGDEVTVHADPTATISGTRFYLHCRNFASALEFLISREARRVVDRSPPLKIHVGGEREISNLQLAETIARIIGRPLRAKLVDFHSSRPGHDLRYALDSRLIRDLGWRQPVTIGASLEKTVHWYLDDKNRRWLYAGLKEQ